MKKLSFAIAIAATLAAVPAMAQSASSSTTSTRGPSNALSAALALSSSSAPVPITVYHEKQAVVRYRLGDEDLFSKRMPYDKALEYAERMQKSDQVVLSIFPEGTREYDQAVSAYPTIGYAVSTAGSTKPGSSCCSGTSGALHGDGHR